MEENPSGLAAARWNSLPDDILDNILNRLDLFPTISIIISDTTFGIELREYDLSKTALFWNILDNVFTIFANLPLLNTFHLQLPDALHLKPSCWHIIGSWARRLRQHNLQHFEVTTYLSCEPYGGYPVGMPSVFRMNSLVSLDLNLYIRASFWSIPNSIDLPNLKKLNLRLVNYTNLGMLISSCPSLTDLNLKILKHLNINNKDSITISSKLLKRLNLYLDRSSSILEVIIDAPKLKHLEFFSSCCSCDEIMLDSITHVKSLTLVHPSILPHNYPAPPTKTVFPNITRLELALGPFDQRIEHLSSILHCPNLEELVLKVTPFFWMVTTREPKFAPFDHVKRLKLHMELIRLDRELLELVAYILRSAPVLEKLILYATSSYNFPNSRRLPEDFYGSLFEFPRISSHCQIELTGAYGSSLRSRD